MKITNLIAALVFGCFICFWTSCVSVYRPIQPEDLTIDDYLISIDGANVQIGMDYDVLTGPHNKLYAKMEKKNKVSLVLLDIHNSGQKELNITQDLVFQNSNEDHIIPFAIEAGLGYLVDPVTNEDNSGVVEVEVDSWIWGAGKAVNDTKKVVSHVKFVSDMSVNYLDNLVLLPGKGLKGFLVLPVKKHTPLDISLRQDF